MFGKEVWKFADRLCVTWHENILVLRSLKYDFLQPYYTEKNIVIIMEKISYQIFVEKKLENYTINSIYNYNKLVNLFNNSDTFSFIFTYWCPVCCKLVFNLLLKKNYITNIAENTQIFSLGLFAV